MAMWAMSHGASWGASGGAQLSQGSFTYQAGPGDPDSLAMRNAVNVMQAAWVCGVLVLALPAAVEVLLGYLHLGDSCDQPLAQWLLIDGGVALAIMALVAVAYLRIFGVAGDEELQLVETRVEQGGFATARYEERHKVITPCEQLLLRVVQMSAGVPVLSLVAGCALRGNAELCDPHLLSASSAVLVYKPLAGLALCCCWPCLLALFPMALVASTAMDRR